MEIHDVENISSLNEVKENIKKKFNIDISNEPEKELMEEHGYDRICGLGKIKFVKFKNLN